MSEINKINIIPGSIKAKAQKTENAQSEKGKAFEDQLLKTVEKLETMGNEIDAMMETGSSKSPTKVTSDINTVGNYIKSMAGMVEDFSSDQEKLIKSAKYVADKYEKMNVKKEG